MPNDVPTTAVDFLAWTAGVIDDQVPGDSRVGIVQIGEVNAKYVLAQG
jgi:hypothetical protein